MKNFIFKSSEEDSGLTKNLFNKLDTIQTELRHQRYDNTRIIGLLEKLIIADKLQKQVDEYFEKDETSPQTDSDEH